MGAGWGAGKTGLSWGWQAWKYCNLGRGGLKALGGDSAWEIILASYNKYTLHYFIITVIFGTILAVDSHILQSYSKVLPRFRKAPGMRLEIAPL